MSTLSFIFNYCNSDIKMFELPSGQLFMYLSSGYLIVSAFLFIFPNILHKKVIPSHNLFAQAVKKKKMLKISHRGSPCHGTQNTIQAFRKVFHISDMLEMDVCETQDNVLVVHHDKSLLRSCGVEKLISQLKYENLPRYQNQIKLDFAFNKYMPTNNQKIPKLETVFQIFQGVPMDIQLKTPTQTAIKQFVRLIHEYNRQQYTIIGIRGEKNRYLSKQYMNRLKKQQRGDSKSILTFMNDTAVIKLYLAYITGLLPFVHLKQSSLQIPIYSKEFKQWCLQRAKINNQSQLKVKIGTQMIRFMNFISKPLIWHLRQRGIMTFGWVCNSKEAMQRANWMGVQGIMSDQPYLLDQFVKNLEKQKQV